MSFSRLPYELQEAILAHQDKSDLASLCLVSKSFLEIARPLLYRSLKIKISLWGGEKEILELNSIDLREIGRVVDRGDPELDYWQKIWRQWRLFETLQQHPDWRLYILELEFSIGMNVVNETELKQFLLNIPNLVLLTLVNSHNSPVPDQVSNFVVENISSSSITSLDLEFAWLSALAVLKLFKKTPLLRSLLIGSNDKGGTFIHSVSAQKPDLKHLEQLKLSYTFYSRSFFSSLVTSPASLKSLELEWIGVQALVPSLLSDVHHLSIYGEKNDPQAGGGNYPTDLDAQIVSVLDACSSLKSLRLSDFSFINTSDNAKELERRRALHRLPPSLESLSLNSISFSSSYLLDFLSTTCNHLRRLSTSSLVQGGGQVSIFGPTHFDVAAEERIEQVCQKRDIVVSWIGGRNKSGRSEGIPVEMMRQVANLFSGEE
ncbi:hypothetical protein JCM5350_007299 [Sporobolomyces pararoseus]